MNFKTNERGGWIVPDLTLLPRSTHIPAFSEIGDYCKLDDGCMLGNCCTLGEGCKLGNCCTLGAEKILGIHGLGYGAKQHVARSVWEQAKGISL